MRGGFRLLAPGALLVCCTVPTLTGCGSGVNGAGTVNVPTAVSTGPQLGYAWRADDKTLRPLLGVPGSSQVGASITEPGEFVAANASAASSIALLIGTDGQLYRMSVPAGTPTKVGTTAAAGAKVRFSPSGTAAVVYVPGAQSATVVTSLSTTPSARVVAASAPILDAAPSDSGTVAALLQAGSGATVSVLTASGGTSALLSLRGAGDLSFVGSGDTLLAADSAANTLTQIASVSTSPAATTLATAGLLKSPGALGATHGGRWAVVANSSDSSVVRVDLTGGTAPQRVAVAAQPTMVEPLAGTGVFRFTDVGSSAAWMGDMAASIPSVLFIPASK